MSEIIVRARELKAGSLVEVRTLAEIMDTLDENGSLNSMPFMPEMAAFCGQRMRVAARAHKTCDTVTNVGNVRVPGAVHLENSRCDGSAHEGCQAACLLFWKEEWLKPVTTSAEAGSEPPREARVFQPEWSYKQRAEKVEDAIFRCQATEIPMFSTPLNPYDPRQYVEDLTSRNIGLGLLLRGFRFAAFRALIYSGIGYRFVVRAYNWYQKLTGGSSFPWVTGTQKKTPTEAFDLKPGEWVEVKSFDEILATLNHENKNRGLGFDISEMRLHCGKKYRVHRVIEKIIDEREGKLVSFPTPSVTLENVYCIGEATEARLFCPRAITPYWRQIWLRRIDPPSTSSTGDP